MKLIPYYALAAVALPILVPIGGVVLLSTLPAQLSKSKRRIQQSEEEREENKEPNTDAANAEEIVFEAAVNLKNLTNSQQEENSQEQEYSALDVTPLSPQYRLSNFITSPHFPKVSISEVQHNSFLNLNKLQLDKVVVCMNHAIHPHASIIVRGNFYDEGKQLLKSYVEEVFQP
jgi:hypothetical protein